MLVRDKRSSLLYPFVSYAKDEVLWIRIKVVIARNSLWYYFHRCLSVSSNCRSLSKQQILLLRSSWLYLQTVLGKHFADCNCQSHADVNVISHFFFCLPSSRQICSSVCTCQAFLWHYVIIPYVTIPNVTFPRGVKIPNIYTNPECT
jgi:hypothetical protein